MDLITNGHQHEAGNDDVFSSKHEWTWDKKLTSSSLKLSDDNLNVTFHPVYSTGTAVVKGNKPLEKGRHHFWEILMITHLYGTDIMVGVGTANAELHNAVEDYCALLGRDQESWGFSYKGYLQHDGKTCKYGTSFGENNSVGVHLDTWTGTLQFFIDRKPLGVAFTRLNNVVLYPLVSSTMAQCEMKLSYSCSTPVSLQTACLAVLSPSQKAHLATKFPGLRYITQNVFADILQKTIDYDQEEDIEFPAEYIILDDFDYALVGLGVKRKKRC
ncbi:PREDICTED: SPRY domain-containing SOCS box protein 3-like isoform X1 [Vollenhovia emeryi]|uniref:SPRY domain-containing SOCS box protein 3-like isoform X1 n=1 Tax=Vollenhovia emeryi TaxID=411798 RepID=UPI0005F44E3B|nr:PREDICTED: SPRY domain-containing SOCS box protein 3-like isoform X1 [Vollenhovia emeryi]